MGPVENSIDRLLLQINISVIVFSFKSNNVCLYSLFKTLYPPGFLGIQYPDLFLKKIYTDFFVYVFFLTILAFFKILSLACFSFTFYNPMTPRQNIKYMVKIGSLFSLTYNLIFELHLKNAKEKQGSRK